MTLRMWKLKLLSLLKIDCSNEMRKQIRKYGHVNLPKGVFIVDGKSFPSGFIISAGADKTDVTIKTNNDIRCPERYDNKL